MFGLIEGDNIKVGELETHVTGFNTVGGQQMVSTPYGDFHPDLVKKVDNGLEKK